MTFSSKIRNSVISGLILTLLYSPFSKANDKSYVDDYKKAMEAGLMRPESDFASKKPHLIRDVSIDETLDFSKDIDWAQKVSSYTYSDSYSEFQRIAKKLAYCIFEKRLPDNFYVKLEPKEKMVKNKNGTTYKYAGYTGAYIKDGKIIYGVVLPEEEKLANLTITFFNELGNIVCPNPNRILNEAASYAVQEIAREYLESHAPGFSKAYDDTHKFAEDIYDQTEWVAWHLIKKLKSKYGSFEEAYETIADKGKYEQRKPAVDKIVEDLKLKYNKRLKEKQALKALSDLFKHLNEKTK